MLGGITAKEAVEKAIEYARSLYDDQISELSLEEIEKSEDGKFWLVTLGFVRPDVGAANRTALALLDPHLPRVYRVFAVHARTGEVASMKIRELSTV